MFKLTIQGRFKVTSAAMGKKNIQYVTVEDCGPDAGLYPERVKLALPEGHVWQSGAVADLMLAAHPKTYNSKEYGSQTTYYVEDYTAQWYTVEYKVVESGNGASGADVPARKPKG